MNVRFGYVSHALSLWDCSPAKTLTFARWSKLSKEERIEKLYEVTQQNLYHTKRALHYNMHMKSCFTVFLLPLFL